MTSSIKEEEEDDETSYFKDEKLQQNKDIKFLFFSFKKKSLLSFKLVVLLLIKSLMEFLLN